MAQSIGADTRDTDKRNRLPKIFGSLFAESTVSPNPESLGLNSAIARYPSCLMGLLFDAVQGRTRGNESRIIVTSLLGMMVEIPLIIYVYL